MPSRLRSPAHSTPAHSRSSPMHEGGGFRTAPRALVCTSRKGRQSMKQVGNSGSVLSAKFLVRLSLHVLVLWWRGCDAKSRNACGIARSSLSFTRWWGSRQSGIQQTQRAQTGGQTNRTLKTLAPHISTPAQNVGIHTPGSWATLRCSEWEGRRNAGKANFEPAEVGGIGGRINARFGRTHFTFAVEEDDPPGYRFRTVPRDLQESRGVRRSSSSDV
jgi:hypothetical protein